MKVTVLRAGVTVGLIAAAAAAVISCSGSGTNSPTGNGSAASTPTIRIAEHRQPRIEALNKAIPKIEQQLGVVIEVVEYPAPEKDYLSKLLTELGAGNAPDLFTANFDSDVPDMVSAGYLASMTAEVKAWDGYHQLFDVAKRLSTSADGQIYALDSMLLVQQLYFRRDLLDKAGISTAQPASWKDLLDRAREIKAKTGKYGLLLPAGLSWGPGAFNEGFNLFVPGSKTPHCSVRSTVGKHGRNCPDFAAATPDLAGSPEQADCACTQFFWTRATRRECSSRSQPRARSAQMTAANPGSRLIMD